MDCIVHGVAKSRTRLSHFTHSLTRLLNPVNMLKKTTELYSLKLKNNMSPFYKATVILDQGPAE